MEECIRNVKLLMDHPEQVYEMKKANREYYEHYLKADKIIENTLQIILD